ncbi:MAG: alpha/beta hydrolase-fold protein, partial [Candidatus Izemoplasmatales bacterium]|nr:alpha/beta hydrolase-fold protein [Candidatus Izemoplasmatales bacterium]
MERTIIKEIFSKNLKRNKKIRVILPLDYFDTKAKEYPVLYMHDGQNLVDPSPFSNHSWEVLKTMDKMYQELGGIIIVGIDSDEFRIMEYSNYLSTSSVKRLKKQEIEDIHPEGDQYGLFIIEELKPLIDGEFRTKKDR